MDVTNGMEKLGVGVWWGTHPKIGEDGVIIHIAHRTGNWRWSRHVADVMKERVGGEAWFGVVSGRPGHRKFEWSHGMVDVTGKITQIG